MEQRIHIGRRNDYSIDFDLQEMFIPLKRGEEASFEMSILNHGPPTHVHLSITGEIKNRVILLRDNPYVKKEEKIPVVVRLPKDGKPRYRGEIFVSTGYGSQKSSFPIEIGSVKKKSTKKRKVKGMPHWLTLLSVSLFLLGFIFFTLFITFTYFHENPYWGCLASSIAIVFMLLYLIGR